MTEPDRDDLLRAVDLEALLEDLAASRGLERRGRQFPCPNVSHEQTGKTPPATVKPSAHGYGLFHCHSCGSGGTAIDALIAAGEAVDVAAAFALLKAQQGHPAAVRPTRVQHVATTHASAPRPAEVQAVPQVDAAHIEAAREVLAGYVADCARQLWTDAGAATLQWLRDRGLTDEEIRASQLGHDLGYRTQQRPRRELPAPRGPAAVLPLLDDSGTVIYAQARPLGDPEAPKYLNPHSDWIGPSPRVGAIPSSPTADRAVLVVCEGICDAIIAARHFDSRAVIGAGQPDRPVAQQLLTSAAGRALVVCFDADPQGQEGADRLTALLLEHNAPAGAITPPSKDVNDLLLEAPDEFDETFVALIRTAAARVQPDRPRPLRWALPELDGSFLNADAGRAYPTGYADLDATLAGGLRPGVYMIAAPPAVGKTAFAAQAAWHIARSGHPVIYLATEQTREQLVARHVCSQAQLNISHYWKRTREFRDAWKLARTSQPLDTLAVIPDEPAGDDDLRGSIQRLAAMLADVRSQRGPTPVVFIDYLQDLRPSEQQRRRDEREQLSAIARSLLRLARRHEVPLVIISSVARDKYETERPTIAAFKGSGDIEYTLDAGLVLRVGATSQEDYDRLRNGDEDEIPLELHIVKNRFGRAGGSRPIEHCLHADTGTVLYGDGSHHDNHPPALPGFVSTAKDNMPF